MIEVNILPLKILIQLLLLLLQTDLLEVELLLLLSNLGMHLID